MWTELLLCPGVLGGLGDKLACSSLTGGGGGSQEILWRCKSHLWLGRLILSLCSRAQVLLEMGGTTTTLLTHHGHMAI